MASNRVVIVMESLKGFTERQMKALTLEVRAQLQDSPPIGTPRDTSWAASNWIPNIGQPIRETDGSPQSISAAKSEAGMANVLTKYKLIMGPIYVSNNVPYIQKLNDGHSKQSPAGFVQIARDRALNKVVKK